MNIHKDKLKGKKTMDEIMGDIAKEQNPGPPTIHFTTPLTTKEKNKLASNKKKVDDTTYKDKFDKKVEAIAAYNGIVTTLNHSYASFKPLANILVRVFLKEPVRGGIIIPATDELFVKTKNGQGVHHTIPNPFPYSTKAVVVATPDNQRFINVGDVVKIGQAYAHCPIPGRDDIVEVQYGFTLPEYSRPTPPKEVTNEHYGYLLLPISTIEGFLLKANKDED